VTLGAGRRYFAYGKNAACQQQGESLPLGKVPLLQVIFGGNR
jgi:hypothetical protein